MKKLALLLIFCPLFTAYADPIQWTDAGCREIEKAVHPQKDNPTSDEVTRNFILVDQCGNLPTGEKALKECLNVIKANYEKYCPQFSPLQ